MTFAQQVSATVNNLSRKNFVIFLTVVATMRQLFI
jgi:hypothetical protein